jgi:hypothetical protein
MTTCQDTANVSGHVSLFLGIETYNWTIGQFLEAAHFAKNHGISSLFIKVSEVGSAAGSYWYGGLQGFDLLYQEIQKVINVIPYAFVYGNFYGNLQQEIAVATTFLTKYGKYCLDMEQSYWSQPDSALWAKTFNDTLKPIPGTLWVSCPSNPIESGQLPFLQAIDQAANALMPMAYSDYLSSTYFSDFQALGCIEPTFDLSNEFGANNVVANIQKAKDAGILAISLWEYNFAVADTKLLDQCVSTFKGSSTPMPTKAWYEYDIVVPFGNAAFDSQLGGSHDLDIGCPPNTPITALLSGTISSISSPAWGKQVGVHLDSPINGKPYCSYLHLSAVNPQLHVGDRLSVGEVVGWCGGANNQAQYAGTTNPTRQNFLNDSFNSSQIQTGFALMDGPEYGVVGWTTFPPVDWNLDPTPVILAARKGATMSTTQYNEFVIWLWELSKPALAAMGLDVPQRDTGIFNLWRSKVNTPDFLGLVCSHEVHHPDENGVDAIWQIFGGGKNIVKWQNGKGKVL